MRFCFVTEGSFAEYAETFRGGADVIVCGFQALGAVSYEKELKGETGLFEDVALLSKEGHNVVIGGCFTDARGMKRKSVVVAERGRILGVSDMLNRLDAAQYRPGAGIKIYETAVGKIGIVVGEDLYFPQVLETLSVCGAEVAICIFGETDGFEEVLMRAGAFLYGLPVCVCAYGYAQAADIGGKVLFATPQSPVYFDFERQQEYHLVETRRRGFFRKKRSF